MGSFCANCGNPIAAGVRFCNHCGAPVNTAPVPHRDAPVVTGVPVPTVGYSTRVNDPEILAAMKKNKKASWIISALLIPLPLVGFTVYSLVSDKMEPGQGIVGGAVVSLIFLLCAVISALKKKAGKPYEAVVTDKQERRKTRHNQNDVQYYTEYVTYVQTTDGKKKKIVEREGGLISAYHYLNIGDRFKYHTTFNMPYYELYDKTNAPYIPCVSCGAKNPVASDRCRKCNIPLLK